jgi:hypothetical protein
MSKDNVSFILGGKRYELSRKGVEEAMKDIVPRPLDKYYVTINGWNYPPKQVLSTVLRRPLVTFTTMDAQRVLHSLGFEVGLAGQERNPKTESERLFEEYLYAQGIADFQHEAHLGESLKRPDYLVAIGGTEIFFEVKQFRATDEDFRLGTRGYDPYGPIREKIDAGRKQFKDLKDYCCCLVLYNREKPLVDLGWQFIYGAMLGNMAVRMPFDPARGLLFDQSEDGFFGGGGKMIRYGKGEPARALEPQNRTISAVLVLQQMGVGKRRFDLSVKHMQQKLGRELTFEEHFEAMNNSRGTERDVSLTQLRVVVCENPYARIPLPREALRGPYDERYGPDERTNNRIVRLYVGKQMKQLETQEGPVRSVMQRIAEDSRRKREVTRKHEPAGQV